MVVYITLVDVLLDGVGLALGGGLEGLVIFTPLLDVAEGFSSTVLLLVELFWNGSKHYVNNKFKI